LKFNCVKDAGMKKITSLAGSFRDRWGSTGSTGSITTSNSGSRATGTGESSSIEIKIDSIIREQ